MTRDSCYGPPINIIGSYRPSCCGRPMTKYKVMTLFDGYECDICGRIKQVNKYAVREDNDDTND